jgi:hypothetical protein
VWAVAALIGAVAFAALVALLAVPLLKLGRTLDEATLTLKAVRETPAAVPMPVEIARVVLERGGVVDAGGVVTRGPAEVDGTAPAPSPRPAVAASPLGAVVSSTLGDTLIKAAAYGHGVRSTVRSRLEPAPSRPLKALKRRR